MYFIPREQTGNEGDTTPAKRLKVDNSTQLHQANTLDSNSEALENSKIKRTLKIRRKLDSNHSETPFPDKVTHVPM